MEIRRPDPREVAEKVALEQLRGQYAAKGAGVAPPPAEVAKLARGILPVAEAIVAGFYGEGGVAGPMQEVAEAMDAIGVSLRRVAEQDRQRREHDIAWQAAMVEKSRHPQDQVAFADLDFQRFREALRTAGLTQVTESNGHPYSSARFDPGAGKGPRGSPGGGA